MNCRECNQFLLDYTEGRLPESERAAFEQHLDRCPPCKVYVRQYQDCIAASRAAMQCQEPRDRHLPEELVRAILAAKRTGK